MTRGGTGCDCPDVTECLCSFDNTDCFIVNGTGTDADPFTVEADLDPATTNLMECTTAGLGAYLPDLIADPPRAAVRMTVDNSIASSVEETLVFDSETYDSDSMVNIAGAPGRITITEDGLYIVHAILVWEEPVAAAFASASVYNMPADNNIATDARYITTAPGDPAPRLSIAGEEELDAGTYLEIRVFQNTGSAVLLTGATLSARYVAPKVA